MLKDDIIEAVIGLAPNLFYGASIPACILVINKAKSADRRGAVLIINGAEEYKEGKAQNSLTEANVARFVAAFEAWADEDRFARVVPMDEIAGNDHNLNISRYVQIAEEQESIDVAAELSTLMGLINQRNEAEAAMLSHLKELGYAS